MAENEPVILDAGPCLNFFASNKQDILVQLYGVISTTETVRDEVLNRAKKEPQRFGHSQQVLGKLTGSRLIIRPEDLNDQKFSEALAFVTKLPATDGMRKNRNLGELTVLAWAKVLVESGADVEVVIDESPVRPYIVHLTSYFARKKMKGQPFGNFKVVGTLDIFRRAIESGYFPDKQSLRETYARIEPLDDGLIPIEETDLLNHPRWTSEGLEKPKPYSRPTRWP